jgi:serine/threonine protein phosphatase 1
VHGCADRLAALHRLVSEDSRGRPPAERTVLVHLGDYVDRGPDSAGVLDLLLGPPPVEGAEVVNLVGNHEVMMLDAADPGAHPGAWEFWLDNGGTETLRSYGSDPEHPEPFSLVPEEHLAMLRDCPLHWSAGDYLFVHAGIRPEVPLDRQDPFDLIWIREPFLSFDGDLPMVVVHGHSPAATPAVRQNRLGIDTGACFGGALTCLVLEDDRLGFLAA